MHGVLCPKLCPALGLDLGLLIRSAVLGSRGQCVGWPTSVRETDRQVLKMRGDFDAVAGIADGTTEIDPMPGWTNEVFEKGDTEQDAAADAKRPRR